MTRGRSLVGVVVVTLVVVVVGALAGAVGASARSGGTADRWVEKDLGALGGKESHALGINEQGQIVGDIETHAVLWQQGKTIDLGGLGSREGIALGINDRGAIVGWAATRARNAEHAVLWRNGRVIDLGTLGGRTSWARAVNARGEIVGTSHTAVTGQVHAFLWKGGRMTDLGTLGGRSSVAGAINDRGQVAGISETPHGELHVFVWSAGRMRDLGRTVSLPRTAARWWNDVGGRAQMDVAGLNDRGEIVGTGLRLHGASISSGFVLRQGKATALDPAGLDDTVPEAINERGQIVGQSWNHALAYPLLWVGRTTTVLPTLNSGFARATGLNEHGQIVGWDTAGTEDDLPAFHAVLWTRKPAN